MINIDVVHSQNRTKEKLQIICNDIEYDKKQKSVAQISYFVENYFEPKIFIAFS